MNVTRAKPFAFSPLGLLMLVTLSTNLYIISILHQSVTEQGTFSLSREGPTNSYAQGPALRQSTVERLTSQGKSTKEAKYEAGQQIDEATNDLALQPPRQRKLQEKDEDEEEQLWPKPDGWQKMGFAEIRKHFKCKEYAHDQTKPLPSMKDWQLFRRALKQHVDEHLIFNDPVPPMEGYSHTKAGSPPPYYAAHSKDGKGRGLFASRDIEKGEIVHDGGPGDVIFPDGMSFRRFIFNLPRNRACDQIDWVWTQQMKEGGEFHVFSAMNISILINTGKGDTNNLSPKDSYCDEGAKYDFRGGKTCSSKIYATRDIKKDEELLYNYGWYPTVWSKVGLGKVPKNDGGKR